MAGRIFFSTLAVLWVIGAIIVASCWWLDLPLGGGMTVSAVIACLSVAIDICREKL